MNAHHQSHVAQALAHYFGIDAHARFRELQLKRDLGLQPLNLVMFVLELEEADGPPFDFAALDSVVVVDDLLCVVDNWLSQRDAALRQEAALVVDWVA